MNRITKQLAAVLSAATLALGLSVAVSAHEGEHVGADGPCNPAGAQAILDDLAQAREDLKATEAKIAAFDKDENVSATDLRDRKDAQDRIDSHEPKVGRAKATVAIAAAQAEVEVFETLEATATDLQAQAMVLGEPRLTAAVAAVQDVVAQRAVEQRHLVTTAETAAANSAAGICTTWARDLTQLVRAFNERTPEPTDPDQT